jgi:hypothetical protein
VSHSVIPDTLEGEVRWIMVHQTKYLQNHISKNKLGIVAWASCPSYKRKHKKEKHGPDQPRNNKLKTLFQKYLKQKEWRHGSSVVCLPRKYNALSSNPRTAKKKWKSNNTNTKIVIGKGCGEQSKRSLWEHKHSCMEYSAGWVWHNPSCRIGWE